MEENKTIEEGFEQLGQIMEQMEAHDVSLEDSFAMYSEGMKLIKQLRERLDETEKKLLILEEQE